MWLPMAVASATVAAALAVQAAGESACRHPDAADAAERSPAAASLVLGNERLREGDPVAALDAYAESERLARAAGDARLEALASANAARAAVEAGRLDGLAARLDAVLADAKAQGTALRTTLMLHVARSWARWPESDPGARRARVRAAAILAEADALAAESDDARSRSYALGWRGELYEQSGRLDDARTLTRRALVEGDRANAPDALYRWYWQLGRIEQAAGDTQAALAAYRRSVAILDVVRGALALSSADAALAFRDEVEPVYLGLVDLLLTKVEAEPGSEAEQVLLGEARDTLEAQKAAELRDHFRDECLAAQREATPDDVPGAVVLYPVLLPDRAALIVSRGGRLRLHHVPVDTRTLVAEVRAFRSLLTKRTTRQYLPRAQRLYDWLIRPMAPSLAGDEVQALVVVPSGPLRTIPFAALHDRESDRFLIEQMPVALAPGLTLTDPRPIDRERVRLLAAGISEGIHGFPPLAKVDEELDTVVERFPGVKLENESFELKRAEQVLAAQPIGIVHIASHGEFRADASQSFLLTWDGPVPMERVGAAVARTRFRTDQPLELLTLSACQTAAGDDRAALGLAGVALQAGARSALATLWSVSDEATAVLVAEFYTQLAKPGVSRAMALQRAQQKLLESNVYRHPAYWAPFVIISSWL